MLPVIDNACCFSSCKCKLVCSLLICGRCLNSAAVALFVSSSVDVWV